LLPKHSASHDLHFSPGSTGVWKFFNGRFSPLKSFQLYPQVAAPLLWCLCWTWQAALPWHPTDGLFVSTSVYLIHCTLRYPSPTPILRSKGRRQRWRKRLEWIWQSRS